VTESENEETPGGPAAPSGQPRQGHQISDLFVKHN